MQQAEFEKAIEGLSLEKSAYFTSVGSTNDVVAEWAREGAKGLCLAAADEQTRGRGRAGRRWFTPPASALAFSLLLQVAPDFEASYPGRVSGLGALAVSEALEELFKLKPQIKWPNDVLLNGKKVSGVLPEAHWSGELLQALILGIGINVASNSAPSQESLNFPATSVEEALGKPVDPAGLLRAVLQKLIARKDSLDQVDFLAAWQARLAYQSEQVTIDTGNGRTLAAELLGLAGDGGLKLRMPGGETRVFQAGEIQVRPSV